MVIQKIEDGHFLMELFVKQDDSDLEDKDIVSVGGVKWVIESIIFFQVF